jgi:hypothetical protein
VTYRDTSADVTLDANEGIMSSDYEKFWQQIDTLKSDLVAEKGLVRFYTEAHRLVKEENAALKAENERLLPYVDAFRREEGRADKLDRKVDELNAENERLREALQASLQWIDSVPSDTLLPTMPGFDRDYVDGLLAKDFSTQQPVGCGTIIGYEKPVKAEPD